MIAVVTEPIDVAAVMAAVEGTDAGAVVTFVGRVRERTGDRDVTHLDYEAYGEMAHKELTALAEQACAGHGATRVAILHRTGRLELGEVAVAIAVAATHRPEAFEACRWLIDTLKQCVPIWKREHFTDGSTWVAEHP